jgi:hypothetical protein
VLYRILNGADFFSSQRQPNFWPKIGNTDFFYIIKCYHISGPDVAVLRSVSEDDLTNVVQLSPLGKPDPLQGSFYTGLRLRIHIIFASWIRIRIHSKVKIHNL